MCDNKILYLIGIIVCLLLALFLLSFLLSGGPEKLASKIVEKAGQEK